MAMYKISLLGLYNYDNTLFANLQMPTVVIDPDNLPNPFWTPDKDTLIATILEKSSDFPCLYPNFEFMKYMIGVWSKNTAYMKQKLWETLNYKYNPIHNYDRNSNISRTSSTNAGGTVTAASTAFNSDSFKDTGKSTSNETAGGTETITENVSGNIGVMSTQKMIEQQRSIAEFKWYDIVAQDFINKFCVQIY